MTSSRKGTVSWSTSSDPERKKTQTHKTNMQPTMRPCCCSYLPSTRAGKASQQKKNTRKNEITRKRESLILIVILMVADARVLPLMWLMQRNYSVMQIDYTPENFLLPFFPFPFVSRLFFHGTLHRVKLCCCCCNFRFVVGSTVALLAALFRAIYIL